MKVRSEAKNAMKEELKEEERIKTQQKKKMEIAKGMTTNEIKDTKREITAKEAEREMKAVSEGESNEGRTNTEDTTYCLFVIGKNVISRTTRSYQKVNGFSTKDN